MFLNHTLNACRTQTAYIKGGQGWYDPLDNDVQAVVFFIEQSKGAKKHLL